MNSAIEFGAFRLENEICYNSLNQQIELPEQAIKVLQVFLHNTLRYGQQSLSSTEIRKIAWAGRTVDNNNLHQQIIRLRKELGADVIVSTSGPRGYRFNLPVRFSGQLTTVRWRTISVVPFVCLPGFFRDEERLRLTGYHLALGIIHQLHQLTPLEIREISPEHLFPGWQPNTKQIANAQRTELVLSGTLTTTEDGEELRAQLIEAETLNVLWTGKFTVNILDSLPLELNIARQLAEQLGFSLPTTHLNKLRQPNPEAVASYRKGRYLYFTQHAILKEAFDEYSYAVSLDPNYAEPWAGLADIWVLRCTYGLTEFAPNDGMPKALAAVNRALEIDPQCSDAHVTRAMIATLWEWNWELAENHFKQSIQYAPDSFMAHIQYARLLSFRKRFTETAIHAEKGLKGCRHLPLGITVAAWMFYFAEQPEYALALCREALEKAPWLPITWAIQAFIEEATGKFEAAAASCLKAIKLGENLISLTTLGVVYGKLGQRAEAEHVLQQLAERKQQQYTSPYHSALVYAALGQYDEAFRLLELAFTDRAEWIPHSIVDYRLRELHTHPQYQSLAQRAGLLV